MERGRNGAATLTRPWLPPKGHVTYTTFVSMTFVRMPCLFFRRRHVDKSPAVVLNNNDAVHYTFLAIQFCAGQTAGEAVEVATPPAQDADDQLLSDEDSRIIGDIERQVRELSQVMMEQALGPAPSE